MNAYIREKKKKKKKKMIACMLLFSFALMTAIPASATTIISIDNVFMNSGEDTVASIMINNVSNLGVADVNLTFDPSVVHVLSAGNGDFDFLHAVIDNSTGVVRIGGIDYGDGLSGDVKLAEIALKAVGNHGEVSALNISINELKEAGAIETPIPAAEDNGTAFLNLPPVAIAISAHRYNNMGSDYPSKAFFNASSSYDPDNDSITNCDWDFGDGYSGEGKIVEHVYSSYNWNGTGYEPFYVHLTVEDSGGLANTTVIPVSVYMAGDANGDGKVNILDAVIVGREWREECTPSPTSYSWGERERADRADLNNDCKINIIDAVIVGSNWRHTAW